VGYINHLWLTVKYLPAETKTSKGMAANVQDVIMLVGDSLTEGGWAQGGFSQLLAGSI